MNISLKPSNLLASSPLAAKGNIAMSHSQRYLTELPGMKGKLKGEEVERASLDELFPNKTKEQVQNLSNTNMNIYDIRRLFFIEETQKNSQSQHNSFNHRLSSAFEIQI